MKRAPLLARLCQCSVEQGNGCQHTLEQYLALCECRVVPPWMSRSQMELIIAVDVDGMLLRSRNLKLSQLVQSHGHNLAEDLLTLDSGGGYDAELLLQPGLRYGKVLYGDPNMSRKLTITLGEARGKPLLIVLRLCPSRNEPDRSKATTHLEWLLRGSDFFAALVAARMEASLFFSHSPLTSYPISMASLIFLYSHFIA
jgi:hypothetical protein